MIRVYAVFGALLTGLLTVGNTLVVVIWYLHESDWVHDPFPWWNVVAALACLVVYLACWHIAANERRTREGTRSTHHRSES